MAIGNYSWTTMSRGVQNFWITSIDTKLDTYVPAKEGCSCGFYCTCIVPPNPRWTTLSRPGGSKVLDYQYWHRINLCSAPGICYSSCTAHESLMQYYSNLINCICPEGLSVFLTVWLQSVFAPKGIRLVHDASEIFLQFWSIHFVICTNTLSRGFQKLCISVDTALICPTHEWSIFVFHFPTPHHHWTRCARLKLNQNLISFFNLTCMINIWFSLHHHHWTRFVRLESQSNLIKTSFKLN